MAHWETAVVPFVPVVNASDKNPGATIAAQMNSEIARLASQGWEFIRVEHVDLVEMPGCLAGMFGARAVSRTHQMLAVRRMVR
jgi:hypothetical protein